MAFNLTGLDLETFFAVNTAIHVSIFSLVTFPTIILCVVCVVALLITKEIHWKIRVVLINILLAELVYTLGAIALYLGYPLRVYSADESGITCTLIVLASFIAVTLNSACITLYSIVVYVFVKHGEEKIKWLGIVVYLTIAWLLGIITLCVLQLTNLYDFVTASNSFCIGELMEGAPLVDILVAVGVWLMIAILVVITLTFSILTGCYIKHNTIQGNTSVKKAVTKVMLFQWIKIVAIVLQYGTVTVAVSVSAQPTLILSLSIQYIFSFILFEVAVLLTPIVYLIFLKPIREALKLACKKCFRSTTGGNAVHPAPDNAEAETAT